MSRINVMGSSLCIAVVLIAMPAPCTLAAAGNDNQKEIAIPFANAGGVKDWQVIDDATLLLQDVHGHWYVAKLLAPARELTLAESLSFDTPPSGNLEKLGAIVIAGKHYPVLSLQATTAPQRKKK